ncbi:MAG: SDR family NAD(P)-dependent oxidoreductase, partial [Verrucomicrobiota bacterium]
IERLAASQIQANLSANLISSSLLLSLFVKYTKDLPKSKLFVNISSGAALPERAKPGWALYCASKAAQEQLIRAVALEQQHVPYPAKTINFNPGVMDTNMQNLIRETPEQSFPGVDRFIELHRKGQLADPSRVAQNLINSIAVPDALETGKTYQHTDFET